MNFFSLTSTKIMAIWLSGKILAFKVQETRVRFTESRTKNFFLLSFKSKRIFFLPLIKLHGPYFFGFVFVSIDFCGR